MEGGTATVAQRLQALRKLALNGYPVGIVLAPIMAIDHWQQHYANLFDLIAKTLTLNAISLLS